RTNRYRKLKVQSSKFKSSKVQKFKAQSSMFKAQSSKFKSSKFKSSKVQKFKSSKAQSSKFKAQSSKLKVQSSKFKAFYPTQSRLQMPQPANLPRPPSLQSGGKLSSPGFFTNTYSLVVPSNLVSDPQTPSFTSFIGKNNTFI